MISQAPTLSGWALFTDDVALRNIVLFTGKTGLLFLVLSLTCTPVARLLRWPTTLQVRKALGLWGFGFAVCHSLFFLRGKPLFTSLNPGPELWQALQDMMGIVRYGSKVPYAEAGVYALALLCLLAITSNRLAMRRLGKNWNFCIASFTWRCQWRSITIGGALVLLSLSHPRPIPGRSFSLLWW